MTLLYRSTRGDARPLDFADALLCGLAPDGGLFVPETFPALPELDPDATYAQAAAAIMWPFVEGTIDRKAFEAIVDEAYATFDHDDVCPLVPLDDRRWLLELFHGPTIAFKDVALQLVGRLFDHVLGDRGRRATILVATSGDTGSAAMHGCLGRDALDCVVLFPAGRVSDVQRRQMTTLDAPNLHAYALDGTFDDCQDLVKAAFADRAFVDEVSPSAMNSINWGRVMAQVVYYVTSSAALARQTGESVAPVFSVPTGNFGNVLAGWVATQMGLATAGFLVASNTNDILTRWLETGRLQMEEVVPTISPSMDIQVSSNLERLLYALLRENGTSTSELMNEFRATGSVEAPRPERWWGARLDDSETATVIADVHASTGKLIDPHTAVGVGAVDRVDNLPDAPVICLATAHPAKFPDAVEAATGVRVGLPDHLASLLLDEERFGSLPAELAAVEAAVRSDIRR